MGWWSEVLGPRPSSVSYWLPGNLSNFWGFSFLEDEKNYHNNTVFLFFPRLCQQQDIKNKMAERHRYTYLKGYRLRTVALKCLCTSESPRNLWRLILQASSPEFWWIWVGPEVYITNSHGVLMALIWEPHVKNHWTGGEGIKSSLGSSSKSSLSSVTLGKSLNLSALELLHR